MERRETAVTSAPDIDVTLLRGVSFQCLPGCGLCCFASPRLSRKDEAELRQVSPVLRIHIEEGERRLAARPDGGACQFLTDLRCRVHDRRPAPCREFPILVHVGTRLQATVVLSCPGVRFDTLANYRPDRAVAPAEGLENELASVRARLSGEAARRLAEAGRRRRRVVRELVRQGRWVDDEEVRRKLEDRELVPGPTEFAPGDPPSVEEGIEFLPMYYDGRPGPIAMAQGPGGWEALELSAEGGARPTGTVVPPRRPPELDAAARALLSGYLRYWLARDGFLAAVHLGMLETAGGSVPEEALSELHSIASNVLARAAFRATLRGEDGTRLAAPDIELGIRAVDQDWLDRATWGSRL